MGDLWGKQIETQRERGYVTFPISTEDRMFRDQDGMIISSGSPEPLQQEQNAPGGKLELSSYGSDGLFLQAITVLREATQAASWELAQEGNRELNPDRPTTPAPVPVLPFTVRLMLYCGLIVTIVEELRSIVPMPLATDVESSSSEQELQSSSLQREQNSSPSEYRLMYDDPEPPIKTVAVDEEGDVWQRHYHGWTCTTADLKDWSWERLTGEYRLRIIS